MTRLPDMMTFALLAVVVAAAMCLYGLAAVDAARTIAFMTIAIAGLLGLWRLGTTDHLPPELKPLAALAVALAALATIAHLHATPLPTSMATRLNPAVGDLAFEAPRAGITVPERLAFSPAPDNARRIGHHAIASLAWLVAVAGLCLSRRWALRFAWMVALLAVAEGLIALGRWVLVGGRAHGGLFNPNHSAILVVAGLMLLVGLLGDPRVRSGRLAEPLAGGRNPLLLIVLAGAAALLGALLSGSRAVLLLALAVGGVWWLVEWWRARSGRLYAALAVVAVGGLMLIGALPGVDRLSAGSALTANNRLGLWQAAWTGFLESPWMGLGAGAIEWALNRHAGYALVSMPRHAHSDPLQLLAELGLPAFLLVAIPAGLAIVWGAAIVARRWRHLPPDSGRLGRAAVAGLGVLLLHSLVDFPLRVPLVGFVALGLAVLAVMPAALAHPRRS